MSKGRRSNVSPIRKIKSYRELLKEAGDKASPGLKMMADAEASGALAGQLGYSEGQPPNSGPNTSNPNPSATQPGIPPAGSASSSPMMPPMPPTTGE